MSQSTSSCPGFRFAGLACGIKAGAQKDLALVIADQPVAVAGVFTRNRVRAAPVELSETHLEKSGGRARAIIINSGNANACTGTPGQAAALTTTQELARALGCAAHEILVASTGIIGRPLPIERLTQAIPGAVAEARRDGLDDFVQAIMTTDRFEKRSFRIIDLDGKKARLVGVAKGAGMIAPNMATTLAFVFTDAAVEPKFLQAALARAIDRTFNTISVDGDTSTNDSAFAMAAAVAGNTPVEEGPAGAVFERALGEVLDELALAIVRDGEGAEHVVTIDVAGAPGHEAAEWVARAIGGSLLVKTAIHGADPNWGRILAAIGTVGLGITHERINVRIGEVLLVENSCGVGSEAEAHVRQVMLQPSYTIAVDLQAGPGRARHVTCDLGHSYVTLNADYSS